MFNNLFFLQSSNKFLDYLQWFLIFSYRRLIFKLFLIYGFFSFSMLYIKRIYFFKICFQIYYFLYFFKILLLNNKILFPATFNILKINFKRGIYSIQKNKKNIKKIKRNKKLIKKYKKIGVYLRIFLKNKKVLKQFIRSCYLILRFQRKNLFLTLLNNEGYVLCKTNLGSCGFKKKVKFTGFAIKRTSRRFSKKILGLFIKTLNVVYKDSIYKYNKIESLHSVFSEININLKEIQKLNDNILNKNLQVKKTKKVKYQYKFFLKKKKIKKNLKRIQFLNNLLSYRAYPYLSNEIRQEFTIKLRFKSNIKFWGCRFIMYGLSRRFRSFKGLEVKLPVPHSNGLRLKKKRRV